MDFPCSSCGACCRRVRSIAPTWPTTPDGACIHLTKDNRCAIYETRPLICRIRDLRPSWITVKEWHAANAAGCNRMQEEDGLDRSFRLTIDLGVADPDATIEGPVSFPSGPEIPASRPVLVPLQAENPAPEGDFQEKE